MASEQYKKWMADGWICAGDAVKELEALRKGVSRQTLHNWRKAGKVEARHILDGNREYYLFKREDLGLPQREEMPEKAVEHLRQIDGQFNARAEVITEVMFEKVEPMLERQTREVVETLEAGRAGYMPLLREIHGELSRLADSQERIAEALEHKEEERRPWWRRLFS